MMERGGNDFPRERGFGMKIKVNPFAVLLLLFSVFFLDRFPLVCLVFAACAHELSHLCLFHFFGVRTRQLEILPFGIAASFDGVAALSYRQELVCVLAGPLANFLCAALFFFISLVPVFSGRISGAEMPFLCNLALGIVNLLPIYPLDGGRCLFCLLKDRFSYEKAEKMIRILSFLFLLPLLVAGIVLALDTSYNFSLIFIFAYLVCYLLFNGTD